MKLTNKCSDAFDKYVENNCKMVYHGCPDYVLHAIAISFFDSVGINIEITIDINNNANSCDEYCENCDNCYDTWNPEYEYCIYVFKEIVNNTNDYSTSFSESNFETRNEALVSAINKANEIFNAKDENFDKPLKDLKWKQTN